ncbi:unnamed protein product [Auanema sp. JU1783]|nr:unnamed protein product [Auanema sp. JU1783]
MYKESMANGFAATVLFMIFLFLLARHIRRMRTSAIHHHEESVATIENGDRRMRLDNLPPAYSMPPPPTYQEALKMGMEAKY